ncbi:Crp/Fnr family transcriptional regulator [Algibacter amylolyticus]|uniref:Crp/Fnr family transcriptional regulator n=1 Tax=Algibacter amylolyticus TaxID=1608400 RepID=A0A5M7B7C1_9FLAO|nr:Crp/Fnr family transcriptional regulator [Algibacter amylolyticus]KAA5823544.1 Crp/Fnr family transcriptional regulator [Algibacter amylolyticus]MBB5267698.1 CRP-like cAMP-binding protein [Algibacter amylolyticus]TSJ74032.1 Crp/Fnr family transcriptional regulator [Algibacter amylolyticus]
MKHFKSTKSKILSKGDILLSQGEIAKYGYFVKRGCLKSYVIDSTGKERIMQFAPEKWMVSDLDSIANKVPSMVFIEAIEESEVLFLSNSDFEDIDNLDKDIIVEMAIKFRNNLIASNKRIIGLLSATSEQRYTDFIETYPSLVNRLSLKSIAAYIGVTPEYLSDIRRKIAKK